jgi:hypothetical protein
MLFPNYRKLSQEERALIDGRLITYHFYVAGATLLILGFWGLSQKHFFASVAVVFGTASVVMGAGLHLLHRYMVRSPQREAYLATVSVVLGRHPFPVLPSLLGVLVVFSFFVTVLYIFTG